MTEVVELESLRLSRRASRFEGRDHGSSISFFLVEYRRGDAVGLHRHPYDETFVVQAGEGVFSVDGEEIPASAGQVVVVPAGAAHGFRGAGDDVLRVLSVHPSDHVIQEDLE
jgi:quercetin dioxygenase-like cupin family protein